MNVYYGVREMIHPPNKALLFGSSRNNKLASCKICTFSNLADGSIQETRITVLSKYLAT